VFICIVCHPQRRRRQTARWPFGNRPAIWHFDCTVAQIAVLIFDIPPPWVLPFFSPHLPTFLLCQRLQIALVAGGGARLAGF